MNAAEWRISPMGRRALLIQATLEAWNGPHVYYQLADHLRSSVEGILDAIPAYESLVLRFQQPPEIDAVRGVIGMLCATMDPNSITNDGQQHEIPVDFSLGLDWHTAEQTSGLTRSQYIEQFCGRTYPVAMLGFLPGFVYLDELPVALHLPRLESARTEVASGSVAIGGGQCGIYRLPSPGGWQIIGRTALDRSSDIETTLKQFAVGDRIHFVAVS